MTRAIKTIVVSFSKKPSGFLTQDADESARRNDPTASPEPGASVVGNSVRMSWTQVSSRHQPDGRLRKVTFVDCVCKKV